MFSVVSVKRCSCMVDLVVSFSVVFRTKICVFVVFSINVFLRRTDERHWQYSDPIFICDLKRVLEAKQAKTCTIYICTKRAHQLDLNTTSQSFQINSANLYRGKSTQIHYTYNTPTYTLLRTLSWKAAAQRCPLVEDFYLIRRSFKCRPL